MNTRAQLPVLVGHPFIATGRGEDLRCVCRSMRSVGMCPGLFDVHRAVSPDAHQQFEFGSALQESLGKLNVFCLNGDEVEPSLRQLQKTGAPNAYNIAYPNWELANYPTEWARQLDRFDEVWAPSTFVKESLARSCQPPVYHMPLPCEVVLESFLGRRYFGIPERGYVFLFLFDVRSYVTRKNPQAVIEAFRRFLRTQPASPARLVIK